MLAEPGDIAINDIEEFVELSSNYELMQIAKKEETEQRLKQAELERERFAREAAEKAMELEAAAARMPAEQAHAMAEKAEEKALQSTRVISPAGVLVITLAVGLTAAMALFSSEKQPSPTAIANESHAPALLPVSIINVKSLIPTAIG